MTELFTSVYPCEKRDFSNGRFYRGLKEDQELNAGPWFPSVTTIINAVLNKGPFFNKWLADLLNYDEYRKILDETSQRGEIIHKFCMDLIMGKKVNLAQSFISEEEISKIPDGSFKALDVSGPEYSKRLEDFEAFWEEYKPIPLAVEIPLLNPIMMNNEDGNSYFAYPFAGQADLICEIKGERWLIDWKTGSSLWDSHELQVTGYKILWDSLFPDYQIDRLGLLHLKDNCKTPKGRLKEVQFAPKGWSAILDLWGWRNPDCQPNFEEDRKLEFNLYPEEEDD